MLCFQGNTPLHLAPSLQMANYLVSVGARLELTNLAEIPASQRFEIAKDHNIVTNLRTCASMYEKSAPTVTDGHVTRKDAAGDASACRGCASLFTFVKLRHECQRCRASVCHACSGKVFNPNSQRCCDSCYNFLRHRALQSDITLADDASNLKPKEQKDGNRNHVDSKRKSTWQEDVEKTTNTMDRNRSMLIENSLKLNVISDKAGEVADAASNFEKMATLLAAKKR